MLIQNIYKLHGGDLIRLYSNALVVLELSSWKWPSSAMLAASLIDLMSQMKKHFRIDWSDRYSLGEVRI